MMKKYTGIPNSDGEDQDISFGGSAGAATLVNASAFQTSTASDPVTAIRDMNIPDTLVRHFGHADCGIYAEVVAGGTVDGIGAGTVHERHGRPNRALERHEEVADPGVGELGDVDLEILHGPAAGERQRGRHGAAGHR